MTWLHSVSRAHLLYVFRIDLIRIKSDYRHTALFFDRLLLNIQTQYAYCQVPYEY
jgi:hypothetical protein